MYNEKIVSLIDREIREQIVTTEELPGGANSNIYLASGRGDNRYIVKEYRKQCPGDNRDRLSTEFEALSFLWNNGVRHIPRPFCRDQENRLGVYQYIKGRQLEPDEISAGHLEMAADFICELFSLKLTSKSGIQPLAAEACLSLNDYVNIVEKRLEKLLSISGTDELAKQLRLYLDRDFTPVFQRVKEIFSELAAHMKFDPRKELTQEKRTLSPSDFGFHNVILTEAGRLVFIDFEYYGWDDPAKLIADFYLQPAVPVPSELREYFLKKLDFLVANDSELIKRLPFAYLFSSFKWSLLRLNCFLHNDRLNEKELLIRQLQFSSKSIQHLEDEIAEKKFPINLL